MRAEEERRRRWIRIEPERDMQLSRAPQRQDLRDLPLESYQDYPGTNLFEERDRQRQRLGRELRELDHRIEGSDGYRFFTSISLLKRSYFVFDVNHLHLKNILDEFEQLMVFLKMWEEKNRERFDLFINDVIRFFHTYLTGTATLLEHLRTFQGSVSR